MPYTNIRTGKIVGCEEGTFAYLHEEGHNVYNNSENGIRNNYRAEIYFKMCMMFTIIAFIYKSILLLSVLCLSIHLFYFWYEEWWCNRYANRKLK